METISLVLCLAQDNMALHYEDYKLNFPATPSSRYGLSGFYVATCKAIAKSYLSIVYVEHNQTPVRFAALSIMLITPVSCLRRMIFNS